MESPLKYFKKHLNLNGTRFANKPRKSLQSAKEFGCYANIMCVVIPIPVLDPKCPPFCHSQPKSCSTTTTRNKKILKTCSVLLYSSSDYNLRSKKTKKILFR